LKPSFEVYIKNFKIEGKGYGKLFEFDLAEVKKEGIYL